MTVFHHPVIPKLGVRAGEKGSSDCTHRGTYRTPRNARLGAHGAIAGVVTEREILPNRKLGGACASLSHISHIHHSAARGTALLSRGSQLIRAWCHALPTAAQSSRTSAPIYIGPASAATAGGFLQVVVSKTREHTVLVRAPCPTALPIQH